MLKKHVLYVTGLPRSGSTLLCQLLGMHADIYSPGHSSPLSRVIGQLRHNLSDNDFLLAQLDTDFDLVYQRLLNAFRGFMDGWFTETDRPWVVDKSRGWLNQLEFVHQLHPGFRMLVCVREPSQIYGSIEAQHQKTLLLDFPDHLANLSRHARARKLFEDTGVVGGPLQAIHALQDVSDSLQQRLYYVVYEHLVQNPVTVMQEIHGWLGLEQTGFDPDELPTFAHESDSYYRFKYRHQVRNRITPPQRHEIPGRIEREIREHLGWFYDIFYPQP